MSPLSKDWGLFAYKGEKMSQEKIICGRCKQECKEQIDSNPTFFGSYIAKTLVEAICIDCWKKGENWDKLKK